MLAGGARRRAWCWNLEATGRGAGSRGRRNRRQTESRLGWTWAGAFAGALLLPGILHQRSLRAAPTPRTVVRSLDVTKPPRPSRARPLRVAELDITAYCAHCAVCDTGDQTASGRNADLPGVAVAEAPGERALPLGAQVFIPRLGWLPVDDTGGAVGPHQLDVRLPSHVAAAHWGRRRLRVRWKPARR